MEWRQLAKLTGCSETKAAIWARPITQAMARYLIDQGALRVAAFLAQIAHESGLFTITEENLKYSAQGLLQIFPKYFNEEQAAGYAKQPEKIANRVYSGRLGNGDEASGDGWAFRGRGLIQLTGRANYTACSAGLGVDLVGCPELLADPETSAQAAGWFWDSRKINMAADQADFEKVTRLVNGGLIGLEDRRRLYKLALAGLQQKEEA